MKIGWIGTGIMGNPMCHHILQKLCSKKDKLGTTLVVYNRTVHKTNDLVLNGAKFEEPNEMAKDCDVLFMMLGFPEDVKEVALTSKNALLKTMKSGSILIDHTTSSPSLAKELSENAKVRDIVSIDAPVSGGDIGAKAGKLVIMASGCDAECFHSIIKPLFDCYSQKSVLLGENAGLGQSAKIVNQIISANNMLGICEGIVYAKKAGLNVEDLINIIKNGLAQSFNLTNYGLRIEKRDFKPDFYVKHFVKDLGIAVREAKLLNICLPRSTLAEQLYLSLIAHGNENLGFQALILSLDQLNNRNG